MAVFCDPNYWSRVSGLGGGLGGSECVAVFCDTNYWSRVCGAGAGDESGCVAGRKRRVKAKKGNSETVFCWDLWKHFNKVLRVVCFRASAIFYANNMCNV